MAFMTTFRHSATEPVRGREVDVNFDALGVYADATFLPLAGGTIAWTGTLVGTWDFWIGANETWTYASASTFTSSGDLTSKYQIGDKLKMTNSTVKYFYITAISHAAGTTTFTVSGGGTYTLANAAITSPFYSKAETPQGFPAFRSSVVVYNGNGHGSTNTKIRRFDATSTTVGTAITYADSNTNGATFTINEAGIYAIRYNDAYNGGSAAQVGVSVNSNQLTTNIASITAANRLAYSTPAGGGLSVEVSVVAPLAVSDVVRPHTDGLADANADPATMFRIEKVSWR